jgi:hypothetical protein
MTPSSDLAQIAESGAGLAGETTACLSAICPGLLNTSGLGRQRVSCVIHRRLSRAINNRRPHPTHRLPQRPVRAEYADVDVSGSASELRQPVDVQDDDAFSGKGEDPVA